MSNTILRQKLIETIQQTNDTLLLEEAGRLFNIIKEASEPYTLTEAQQAAIKAARQQVTEGKIHTADEINRETEKWLNK